MGSLLPDDDQQFKCLEQQIKFMAIFYLVFSFFDLLLMAVADIIDAERGDRLFLCAYGWYMMPKDDGGSIFMLFDDSFLYLFSLMISHIFYRIPDNHGLLVTKAANADRLSVKMTFFSKNRNNSDSHEAHSHSAITDSKH